jgi:hypothetical protein
LTTGVRYALFFATYLDNIGQTVYFTTTPTWSVASAHVSSAISTYVSETFDFGTYTLRRIQVTFAKDATATFYTTGSCDTIGYLSTSAGFDNEKGEPSDWLAMADTGGDGKNFSFTYNVKSGTTYYYWIRLKNATDTGEVTIYAKIPYWKLAYTSFSSTLQGGTTNYSSYDFEDEYVLHRVEMEFQYSGTATFYSLGDCDTIGYLSTSTDYDSATGQPTNPLTSDDDSGDNKNYRFTCDVEAGTTYYLWSRLYNGTDTGSIDIRIIAPAAPITWGYVYTSFIEPLSNEITLSYSFLGNYRLRRYEMTFAYSGTATFYSTSDYDTIGYLSTSTDYSKTTGMPTNYLKTDDNSGSGNNFKFTYSVTAGTTYYFWGRMKSGATAGDVTFTIVPPTQAVPYFSSFTAVASSNGDLTVTVGYKVANWTSESIVTIEYSSSGTDTWYGEGNRYTTSSKTGITVTLSKAGTYDFRARLWIPTGYVYYSNTVTVTISSKRPYDWAWYSTVAKGSAIQLTALEWTDFCTRINAFREYKGLSSYSFTTVTGGSTKIGATVCNEAYTAISGITGHGTLPSAVSAGDPITASYFNGLKDALNAVP